MTSTSSFAKTIEISFSDKEILILAIMNLINRLERLENEDILEYIKTSEKFLQLFKKIQEEDGSKLFGLVNIKEDWKYKCRTLRTKIFKLRQSIRSHQIKKENSIILYNRLSTLFERNYSDPRLEHLTDSEVRNKETEQSLDSIANSLFNNNFDNILDNSMFVLS